MLPIGQNGSSGVKRRHGLRDLRGTRKDGGRLVRKLRSHGLTSTLRGGAGPSSSSSSASRTSNFPWPYYPIQTKESVAQFFRTFLPYIDKLVKTKLNSAYEHRITEQEGAAVNAYIQEMLKKYRRYSEGEFDPTEDIARILPDVLDFFGSFIITNKTNETEVILQNKWGYFNFLFDTPMRIKASQIPVDRPVMARDWRGNLGLNMANIVTRMYELEEHNFTVTRDENLLFVKLVSSTGDDQLDIKLEITWLGPHEELSIQTRDTPIIWRELTRLAYDDFDQVPAPAQDVNDAMQSWLPHLRKLAETKLYGKHQALGADAVKRMSSQIKDKLDEWESQSARKVLRRDRLPDISHFMGVLKVVNRTPETVVLARFYTKLLTFYYNKPVLIEVLAPHPITDAEVHFVRLRKVFGVTRENCIVRVIGHSLEVKITVDQVRTVILEVTWHGPTPIAPNDLPWDQFFSIPAFSEHALSKQMEAKRPRPICQRRSTRQSRVRRVREEPRAGEPYVEEPDDVELDSGLWSAEDRFWMDRSPDRSSDRSLGDELELQFDMERSPPQRLQDRFDEVLEEEARLQLEEQDRRELGAARGLENVDIALREEFLHDAPGPWPPNADLDPERHAYLQILIKRQEGAAAQVPQEAMEWQDREFDVLAGPLEREEFERPEPRLGLRRWAEERRPRVPETPPYDYPEDQHEWLAKHEIFMNPDLYGEISDDDDVAEEEEEGIEGIMPLDEVPEDMLEREQAVVEWLDRMDNNEGEDLNAGGNADVDAFAVGPQVQWPLHDPNAGREFDADPPAVDPHEQMNRPNVRRQLDLGAGPINPQVQRPVQDQNVRRKLDFDAPAVDPVGARGKRLQPAPAQRVVRHPGVPKLFGPPEPPQQEPARKRLNFDNAPEEEQEGEEQIGKLVGAGPNKILHHGWMRKRRYLTTVHEEPTREYLAEREAAVRKLPARARPACMPPRRPVGLRATSAQTPHQRPASRLPIARSERGQPEAAEKHSQKLAGKYLPVIPEEPVLEDSVVDQKRSDAFLKSRESPVVTSRRTSRRRSRKTGRSKRR